MVIKIGLAKYSKGGELVCPPELLKPCLTTLTLLLPTVAVSVVLSSQFSEYPAVWITLMTIQIIFWLLANLSVWQTACADPGIIPPLSFY